jgi:hypothetical protein
MASTKCDKNTFQAKDALWYPSYVEMVAGNRRANEEHLRSKGLLDMVKDLKQQQKAKKSRKSFSKTKVAAKSNTVLQPLRRSSRRVRSSPPENNGISLEDNNALLALDKEPPRKKKRVIQPKRESRTTLSDEQLKQLLNLPDWLEDMEEWLRTVPHGNGTKVVSSDNARTVMKQVRSLVAGVGITYRHWQEGACFQEGIKIHLGMDLDTLFDDAVEMENEFGRDLGNGWLLKHPIRKMQLYQYYRTHQGA